jgi:hypothetical protein
MKAILQGQLAPGAIGHLITGGKGISQHLSSQPPIATNFRMAENPLKMPRRITG